MARSKDPLGPISRWLNHVDEQVPPGAGVETLKLALYPFIKTKYAEAQALPKPSQVYHFLEKHFNHNKQKALQWFVYALCCLQSRLNRGTYLVGDACQKRYEITLPDPPKAEDIDIELKFYECLAKICDKAQGAELEGKLKEEFSKKGILDTNPQHLSHLPQMFFRLIQREKLGPRNTKRLVWILEKQYQSDDDDPVTRWCQFYLNEYLKSAGMPEIPSMQGVTRDQLDPETLDPFENPTATELSSDQVESPRHRPLKGKSRLIAKLRAEYQVDPTYDPYVCSPSKPMRDPEDENTLDQSHDKEESEFADDLKDHAYAPGHGLYRPQSSRQSAKRSRRRCVCVLFLGVAFGVIMVANALLGGLVWRNLFIRPKFDTFISEAMVIIGELNNYYHQEVQFLSQVNDSQLADHVIEIYAFDSMCNSLSTTANVTSYEESNISENRNFNRLYLLSGSTLSYTITPNREINGSDGIKGYIYVTFGPEIHSFKPKTCHSTDCTIEEHKALNSTHHAESVYEVKRRGYYNLHIIIPQGQVYYSYSLRLASTVLDTNITSEQAIQKIEDTNQTIHLKFKIGKTCLVAYANTDNSSSLYNIIIHLETRVTKLQTVMVVVTTAVPSAVVTLVVIACVVVTGCCCLVIKLHKRRFQEYNIIIEESLSEY